jgi:glutathione S-transferase
MLATTQIAFENVPMSTAEGLAVLRPSGKLPFDQLPLLEIDGYRISQTTALLRDNARRGDLYGDVNADSLWCDMIAGVAADFVEPAIVAAFQPTRAVAIAGLRQRVEKFAPRLEQRLGDNGGIYIAAKRLIFADVVLAEALSEHVELEPDILDDFPLLSKRGSSHTLPMGRIRCEGRAWRAIVTTIMMTVMTSRSRCVHDASRC